jgi:hypothetical protein
MIIGAIGHRVLTDLDGLRVAVDLVLDRIQVTFPGEPWIILSSLAEGADCLVATLALRRDGASLIAVLPMEREAYEADFGSPESRRQFAELMARAAKTVILPPDASRGNAYAAAGAFVVQHCNLLIALWDGRPSRESGGTCDAVDGARARGLPLAWVRAGNRRPDTAEPTTLGPLQGTVAFESFPDPHAPEGGSAAEGT